MELDEVTKFVHKFFPEHQKDQFKEELKKVKSSKKDDIHMRYDSDCWEYKNNLGKTSWFSNQKPQQPHLIFYVNYFINLKQLTKLISLGTMNILLKVKFFTNEKNANDIEKQIVDNIFVKDPEAEEKFYQEKRSQEAIGKVHYDRTFENKKMDEKNAFWNTILTNNYFPVLINPITQLLFSQKMIDKMTHLYINRIESTAPPMLTPPYTQSLMNIAIGNAHIFSYQHQQLCLYCITKQQIISISNMNNIRIVRFFVFPQSLTNMSK